MTDPKQQLIRYNALMQELDTLEMSSGMSAERLAIRRELAAITAAVDALDAPEERDILRLRYMQGGRKLTGWAEVCRRKWGCDDEAHLQAAFRIHRLALEHLREV